MFLLDGEAKYLDVLELILYNGFLSGVSLSGDRFFYQNPLEGRGRGGRGRREYFEVACCPANLARMMAQIGGFVYAQRDDELYVTLFVDSQTAVRLKGASVRVAQKTRYPWDGEVGINVDPDKPTEFSLRVRIPGWARNKPLDSDLYRFASESNEQPTVQLNGKPQPVVLKNGFLTMARLWRPRDSVALNLPMPVRRVLAHAGVEENRGKAAIQRGPLLYCLEGADNGEGVRDLVVALNAPLRHEHRSDLLGGVEIITGSGRLPSDSGDGQTKDFVAIPYYAWANRGAGEMVVWLRLGR